MRGCRFVLGYNTPAFSLRNCACVHVCIYACARELVERFCDAQINAQMNMELYQMKKLEGEREGGE